MGIVIGLESREIELPGDEIVIGRNPAAQLSLAGDARLADQHAVLRHVGVRWLIEAQGEVSIRVGDGRPTKVAWLNPGDVIHLTEAGPTITFSPGAAPIAAPVPVAAPVSAASPVVELFSDSGPIRLAQPTPDKPAEKKPAGGKPGSDEFNIPPELLKDFGPEADVPLKVPQLTRSLELLPEGDDFASVFTPGMIRTIGIAASAAVIFIALWTLFRPRFTLPQIVSQPSAPVVSQVPNIPIGNAAQPPEKSEPAKGAAVLPEKLVAAVHLVLMSAPDHDQTFRVGTAWAVDKRRLVTTGSLALGLQQNREILPNITVQASGKAPPAVVTEILVHPEYRRVSSDVLEAKTELDDLWGMVDESEDETPPEELRPKMLAAQNRLLDALQKQLDYDLAILEVDRDLTDVLPVAEDLAVRPGATVKLIGFPFPKDELLADPEAVLRPVTISGQVQVKVPAAGTEVNHWLAKFRDARPKDNWIGSPVLNANGQVIGIYCQPSPPPEIREDYVPSTHEVTAIHRLSEIEAPAEQP